MKTRRKTNRRTEIGQSLTEFSLALVILLMLFAGVVDLGRMFSAYIIIRDAAQEGAVYGSIADKSDLVAFKAEVENRVKETFTDPNDPSNIPIEISKLQVRTDIIGATCAAPGSGVRVKVEYAVPVTTPFLGTVIGSQDMKMSAIAENAILSPVCP